jgi:hypothetical protein
MPVGVSAAHTNSRIPTDSAPGLESIRTVESLEVPGWDQVGERIPGFTVFHSSRWAAVLQSTYGHRTDVWLAGSAEEPTAWFPVTTARSWLKGCRGVCVALADACAPLLKSGAQFGALWETVVSAGRSKGWRYLELRGEVPVQAAVPAISFRAHRLDLRAGWEVTLRGFDPSVRRAVRKAEVAGLRVRFGTEPADMDAYYALHCLTRSRHGLPPQPKRFFDRVAEHLVGDGHGFVALVDAPASEPPNQPLAGAVFLHQGRRAVYKFGASDARYQQYRANNLVMSQSIRRCVELGMEELHFGRTDPNQEGLGRFKRGWGAQEETLYYYRYALSTGRWETTRSLTTGWHNWVFRHLPLRVNRWLGALLYRHMD